MQNSLTHALIDGPALLAPLRTAAKIDAVIEPARLRLVWSADGDALAMQMRRKDAAAVVAEIDDLLIF